MLSAKELFKGERFTIYEIVREGKSEIKDFLQSLKNERRELHKKLVKLLEIIAFQGPPKNEEKFRLEEDGIYVIKSFQARIFCFFDAGKMIMLTHGVIKKGDRARPEDLKKAKDIRNAWMDQKRKRKP